MDYFKSARKTLFSVSEKEILPPLNNAAGMAMYGADPTIASYVIQKIENKKLPRTYRPCPAILKALSRAVNIGIHKDDPQYSALGGAAVNGDQSVLIADYWDGHASDFPGKMADSDRRILIRVDATGGELHYKAAVVENGIYSPYYVRHDSAVQNGAYSQHSPSAALYAMILAGFILNDYFNETIQQQIQPQMAEIYGQISSGNTAAGCRIASNLANDLYTILAKSDEVKIMYGQYLCSADMPEQFDLLEEQDIPADLDAWTMPIGGKIHASLPQKPQTISVNRRRKKAGCGISDLAGKFPIDPGRVLSLEEQALVPVINPNYAVPDDLEYAAKITTAKTAIPCRDWILRGPSGTGKTEWAKIFASALNLPYVSMTCAKDMTADDLLTTIIPAGEGHDAPDVSALPSAGEWFMDPAGSYEKLTGRHKDDASPEDCQAAYAKAVCEAATAQSRGFRYVDSPLIRALRNGWLVEVQEPSIMHSDVLVRLNSLFDNCRTIYLQTGETLKRHPDAVVVFTTNTGYAGTEPFQESVRTRFEFVKLKKLTDADMIERLAGVTGFTEHKVLVKMVKVYRAAEEKCRQEGINMPTYRNIEHWAVTNAANGMYYKNGIVQFIGGITDDDDEQAALIPCVESQFTPGDDSGGF